MILSNVSLFFSDFRFDQSILFRQMFVAEWKSIYLTVHLLLSAQQAIKRVVATLFPADLSFRRPNFCNR